MTNVLVIAAKLTGLCCPLRRTVMLSELMATLLTLSVLPWRVDLHAPDSGSCGRHEIRHDFGATNQPTLVAVDCYSLDRTLEIQ